MHPLVSVIVPVYNVEQYIDFCVKSIVSQTYSNLEIILINDGTKDHSGMICDAWAKKDHRIKVIHKENGGLSDARNVGLDLANGEWIVFVDSDDYLVDFAIETLLQTVRSNDCDIAICDAVHVFGKEEARFTKSDDRKLYTSEDAICEMWYQKSFLPSAWGKIYKKEIWDELRFTKGIVFEDIDIMHEVFYKAQKICYVRAGLYAYVHREDSITTQSFSRKDLYILNICERLETFASNQSEKMRKAAKAYSLTGNMRVFLATNRKTDYSDIHKKCEAYVRKNGLSVLKNKEIRKKAKIAILLFYLNKKLFMYVHSKINRWK